MFLARVLLHRRATTGLHSVATVLQISQARINMGRAGSILGAKQSLWPGFMVHHILNSLNIKISDNILEVDILEIMTRYNLDKSNQHFLFMLI